MNFTLISIAIFVLAALAVALIIKLAKGGGYREYFDERQLILRGRAYKTAFYTLLIYMSVVAFIDTVAEIVWCSLATAMLFGIVLSAGVFAVYCVMSGAFFAVSGSKRQIVLLIAIGAVNLATGVISVARHGLFENGLIRFPGVSNLLLGIIFCVVLAAAFIKRREDESDEES